MLKHLTCVISKTTKIVTNIEHSIFRSKKIWIIFVRKNNLREVFEQICDVRYNVIVNLFGAYSKPPNGPKVFGYVFYGSVYLFVMGS